MTSKGRAFIRIASEVYEKFGFGSTKTVTLYPRALDYFHDGFSEYDLKWLIKSGYIFHYQVERYNPKRNWRYRVRVDDIYGLTKKGWSVAHKYIKIETNTVRRI